MKEQKTIGMGIEVPAKGNTTPDLNCPFHGNVRVRGNIVRGTVIKAAMQLTAKVQIDRQVYVSKFRRFKKAVSILTVHNPAVINAKVGDVVECIGCRPLSKTKSMTIVRIVKSAQAAQAAQ